MRNIRLLVAYDGTRYSGWQRQREGVPTIQAILEQVLEQLTQAPVRLHGAGRTDAGVHARGQVANFKTENTLTLKRIHRGLNALLPQDVAILETTEVDIAFDSRRNNRGKHYRYQIFNRRERDVQLDRYCWHHYGKLDIAKMAACAQKLVGTHDFGAFRAADCDRETTQRTLYRCTVTDASPLIQIDVEGTAFLKNMVRIIAGTLLDIGRDYYPPELIEDLLRHGDRTKGGQTAPAAGLTMMRVFESATPKPMPKPTPL